MLFRRTMAHFREDETYSTIFTSLKHPIRRKILRLLHERSRSYSEMLEVFKIESSHLNYHLESLGELVSKTADGKYKLSSSGESAITTMSKVEEARSYIIPIFLMSLVFGLASGILGGFKIVLPFYLRSHMGYSDMTVSMYMSILGIVNNFVVIDKC